MKAKFSIIGGDLRTIKLANLLAKEKNIVYTYGLEQVEELKNIENIKECETLNQAIRETEIIIAPIPFSSNGKDINTPFSKNIISIQELIQNMKKKILIAGSIQPEAISKAMQENIEIIDLMKREELAVLNAITTAEGVIEIAMKNTQKMLHGSQALILGFGRIGKVLAKKLKGLSVEVTCAVRKEEDFAWIKAYGYKGININTLGEKLSQYDMIINTVPHLILTTEKLQYVDKQCLLMDLSSKPGGVDEKTAQKMGLKFIWALALPGKVAPITSAEFIKDTMYHILQEKNRIPIVE